MHITIRRYDNSDELKWEEFLQNSNNGTLFHRRKFLNYHIEREFIDHSLIFEKKGKIIAVLPAAEVIKSNDKKILHSHPGTTFGGLVYTKLNFEDTDTIIQELIQYSADNGFASIFIIPPSQLYHKIFNESTEYLLHWHGFNRAETYHSSIIDLCAKENVTDLVSQRKRRYLKKIEENTQIELRWDNDIDKFYPILLDNKQRHNSKPTHTKAELKKLMKLMPDKFHLLMMYENKNPIGGTFIFMANSTVGIIFYNMIDYDYEHIQPASFLILETMKWAKKHNLKYLDFGVSQLPQSDNPLAPSPSLIKFKEQFSSRGMLRIAYQKELK